jgi:HD superfamily phosphodiesterase
LSLITLDDVKKNKEIETFLEISEKQLKVQGYTEHSFRHVGRVAMVAGYILKHLGYSEREVELVKIAGYVHDIGNAVNRVDHAHSGAILAYSILTKMGMEYDEAAEIMLAIGHHDENTGTRELGRLRASPAGARRGHHHRDADWRRLRRSSQIERARDCFRALFTRCLSTGWRGLSARGL